MLVKMFSVDALEKVRNIPESVNAEVWRKQAPGVGIRYDVILRSLRKRRSGERDEQDLTCEINTLGAKRRHRVSSEVFLANNGPVENMNKELCGLVRCSQVASKTSPGSSKQSRDLISETIKSGAESMTQLNDKHFR